MKFLNGSATLLAILTFAALGGCTDASITEVKNASVAQSDYTFGEVFDEAKGCKSTSWESREENGRALVQYSCIVDTPQALVDVAEQRAAASVKAISKLLDDRWKRSLNEMEKRKDSIAGAIVQGRANNELKLRDGNVQLKAAQEKLNQALASSPQEYIGHGRSGYTPQLITMGKERRQLAIERAEREFALVEHRLATVVAAQSDPNDTNRQYPHLSQQPSAEDYQKMIDGMVSWKERYHAAIEEMEVRELKRAEDFLKAERDKKLEMNVSFLVSKKFPVAPQTATWTYDGRPPESVNLISFVAALLDPKALQEVMMVARRNRLAFYPETSKVLEAFPITCGEKIPTGCEVKQAS